MTKATRRALEAVSANVDESMGVRTLDSVPKLSPVASTKDIGRKPLRKYGRVAIDQVMPDPGQPRQTFDEAELQQLASSIRNTGQLHPIRVRWDARYDKWMIITGERRYRATLAAGLSEIECYFHEDELTDSEILEQQLVENLLRQDLKPLEEARGYAALMEVNGWNGKQVAEVLRVSPSKVSRALALLDLPEDVRGRIESGELPRTAAYELSKLDNDDLKVDLGEQVANGTMTQRKAMRSVRQRRGKSARKPPSLRQVFQAENGIKISVSSQRKTNYHEVEQALFEALEEVRLRIENNVQIY